MAAPWPAADMDVLHKTVKTTERSGSARCIPATAALEEMTATRNHAPVVALG